MSLPTTHKVEYFSNSLGEELYPQSIVIKGTLWTVQISSKKILVNEFDGRAFILDIYPSKFKISNALKSDGTFYTDRFWLWWIGAITEDLSISEIEPFTNAIPAVLFEKVLKNDIVQCHPYIKENNPVRLFTLHDTVPKELKITIYNDVKYGSPISIDDLYWEDTRGNDFSMRVESAGTPITNIYTGIASPPNVYSEDFVSSITADFSGSPLSGLAPLTVNFTDLSTGFINTWFWNFGDTGTSSLQNPSHIYTAPGTYTVSLTASGPGSSDIEVKTDYITVNAPLPVADFLATPTSGFFPLVQFTDTSSSTGGTILEWLWDFGDGYTSDEQNPQHRYNYPGVYTVSLKVKDNYGNEDTETKTDFIESKKFSVLPDFEGDPLQGESPLEVQFTDLTEFPSGYSASSYKYSFGDGEESSLQNPKHTYIQRGRFTVTQIVRVDIS